LKSSDIMFLAYALALYLKLTEKLRITRKYRVNDIDIIVLPGVFDPVISKSTIALMRNLDVKGSRVLEIGCGTGLLSIFLEKLGNYVVATEIDKRAARCALINIQRNRAHVDVILTDFARGLKGPFDVIVCNPPYFKGPENLSRAIFSRMSPYLRLMKEARRLRAKKIYTTVSTRSQYFKDIMAFSPRVLDKVKLPMEKIYVLEIELKGH